MTPAAREGAPAVVPPAVGCGVMSLLQGDCHARRCCRCCATCPAGCTSCTGMTGACVFVRRQHLDWTSFLCWSPQWQPLFESLHEAQSSPPDAWCRVPKM
eukprot:scaffold1167_cov418-Prasinococcus_capsulatus_cf.AAC.26